MDKNRLRHLAGVQEITESKVEPLMEMDMGDAQRMAYELFKIAEAKAFEDSQDAGNRAVSGDNIWYHYEEIKKALDHYVQMEVEGEYGQ